MIELTNRKVFVYIDAVDMRKSIDGLCVLLSEQFSADPQAGDLYIFSNRSRNKLKCLFWDSNGFVLYYKRLERGRFHYSKSLSGESVLVNQSQLQALFLGLDFHLLSQFSSERYEAFF